MNYCPNDAEWQQNPLYIEGYATGDAFSFISLDLSLCINKTEKDSPICAPEEEIIELVNGGWVILSFVD
jgi:hypothetical protein